MNKFLFTSVLGLSALLCSPTALAEWSMNASLTTDYIYRGLSLSSGRPAVSGGFDYEQENGLYFGGWLSGIDSARAPESDPSLEVDLYVGYAGETGTNGLFGYSISYLQYMYPLPKGGSDYGELLFDFNISDFVFGFAYTSDAEQNKDPEGIGTFNEIGDLHYYIGYSGEYESGWSVSTTLGYNSFATNKAEQAGKGNPAFYYSWDLGVSKSTAHGEVRISLSKVLNYIGGPGTRNDYERVFRPALSWTTYF